MLCNTDRGPPRGLRLKDVLSTRTWSQFMLATAAVRKGKRRVDNAASAGG